MSCLKVAIRCFYRTKSLSRQPECFGYPRLQKLYALTQPETEIAAIGRGGYKPSVGFQNGADLRQHSGRIAQVMRDSGLGSQMRLHALTRRAAWCFRTESESYAYPVGSYGTCDAYRT